MEKRYWIGRRQAAMGMARGAVSAEVRLIHYDLAGRYSIKAAQCLAAAKPAAAGERAMLHLPNPTLIGRVAPQEESGSETRGEPRLGRGDGR